ncbi:carbamoyl phosphate synthase large subunit [Clostridiales bacterium COT073_COT-073]|nr:carbamoyl phosphate synthase large subunit [Clostridiales bacterium COT073_COT-073]
MNFIVISPNYPQNFQEFSVSLARKGFTVLGIGNESYDELSDKVKSSLRDYYKVSDLHNLDEVKRGVAFLFHKYGVIDRIESQNEYWMALDAELRTQFNVPGLKMNDLFKTRKKSEMKKLFEKAGVPVVPGYLVKERADIRQGVAELSLPLIAKPDTGVGAAATYKLETDQDVADFENQFDPGTPYFLEPFITGDIVTYDGLLDQSGNIVFESGMMYSATPLELLTKEKDIAYFVTKDIDPELKGLGEKIIREFKMAERFFHIEFFRRADGSYITIEYNNRPPGSYAVDMYNYAYSRSLFDDYADMVNGDAFAQKEDNGKECMMITRRFEIGYQVSEEELYQRYHPNIVARWENPFVFRDLQGDVTYIVLADSKAHRTEIAKAFADRR